MPEGKPRRLGRPRNENLDSKILQATRNIIEKDERVSIEAIVQESGASRASVYRRWPSLNHLIANALDEGRKSEVLIDLSGTVKDGFIAMFFGDLSVTHGEDYTMERFRKRMELAMSDPKVQQVYWSSYVEKRRKYPLQALQLAKDRGEIREDVDIDAALDSIYGALYYQFLIRGQDITSKDCRGRARAAFELIWRGMETQEK